jgi:hypothetical protein
MRKPELFAACALLAVATALPAAAGPNGAAEVNAPEGAPCVVVALPIGTDWFDSGATPPRFYWGGAGVVFSTDCFTYTSAVPVEIDLTDAFFAGDQFRLYVDGSPVGQTPFVPVGPANPDTGDPAVAFLDPAYSHGTFYPLPSGTHTLSIEVITNPFDGGGAYIRAVEAPLVPLQAIPTLGTAGLVTLGILLALGAALLLRRRRAA